jgi:hypothetical protein
MWPHVAQVHARGGLAVGGGGYQPHIARPFGRAFVARQVADGLGANVPAVERRHLPDGVIGEQLLQLVDVIGLEGRDIALQQLLGLGRFRRGQRLVLAGADGIELGACPLQQAVHRRCRGSDRVGHLGRPPLQHIAQHQHRALTG